MSDASSSDQPITPPETTSLPAQVEALKKERDKLELERDQAIGRAQSRWKDLQHAQAETRRMQTRNAELESREKAYEGIWLKQRNMIDDAQKALDEAPSAETMDAEKDKLRKEVEEEMQQRLAMETQQLNAEHEQNLQVVHANAVASSKEELEAYVVRVQVSQQAEKAAKQETQMLHEDLQKQRQENDNKDKQVAFLQERLQQQSDRIQELQQQQMQRYTPTRTPTRMAAHGQQIGGGSFLSSPSRSAASPTKGLNGYGSLNPQGSQLKSPYRGQPVQAPHQDQNGAMRKPSMSNTSMPSMSKSQMVQNGAEGMPLGFEESLPSSRPLTSHGQGQRGSQSGFEIQNASEVTPRQIGTSMQPPALPSPRRPSQIADVNGSPHAQRKPSTVAPSPHRRTPSASSMSSDGLHSAMQRPGAQSFVPRWPNEVTDGLYGSSASLQGALPPQESPCLSTAQPQALLDVRSHSNAMPSLENGNMPIFNRQTNSTNAFDQADSQIFGSSPAMHHPTPTSGSNIDMAGLNAFAGMHSLPSQQNKMAYNNGQQFGGMALSDLSGFNLQMPNASGSQTRNPDILSDDSWVTNNTGNQHTRPPNGAISAHLAVPFNGARTSQPLQSPEQAHVLATQIGGGEAPNQVSTPIKFTALQKKHMSAFLGNFKSLEMRQFAGGRLIRLVPDDGDKHSVEQYNHVISITRQFMQLRETQARKQALAAQQSNSQQPGQGGAAYAAEAQSDQSISQPSDTPQLQPYGVQPHPSDRKAKRSTTKPTPAPQPRARSKTPVAGQGPHRGIACTACHEMWNNTWCDDEGTCENCTDKGIACTRPSCEHSAMPRSECPKGSRCNRAHQGMHDDWTLAPYRKDLKRKGKQGDERPMPAKRRRVLGEEDECMSLPPG